LVMAGAGLLTLVAASNANAQGDYPNKPVRIVVDSAPGSATDVVLRIVAERLSRIWNQQVIALNNPGAGGSIAARVAAQSPNDGYTLSFAAASTFTALAGAPGVPANLPIQVPRDFLPIGFVSQQPMFIAASPKSGINSISDLIALAKKSPGEISYATTGVGRITHLTMELLQIRAGIKLQMIPYSGGPSQALSDLIAGRVHIVLDGYGGVAPGMEGGSLKGIAVATIERLLMDKFKLSTSEARGLIEQADAAVRDSTQVFPFTRQICEGMSLEDRTQIIEMLWKVVYADGVLDPYEDMLLRRIAGLIYVPDRERGMARQRALAHIAAAKAAAHGAH